MAIRLYKSREYKDSTPMLWMKDFNVSNTIALFDKIEKITGNIHPEERYNIHYSVAHVLEGNERTFVRQDVIPFDIDGIDMDNIDQYINVVTTVLGVSRNDVGIVSSGNGLHIIIQMDTAFTDVTYFKQNRGAYKRICAKIGSALVDMELPFKDVDANVFRPAATLRLPMTENRKKTGIKQCTVLNKVLRPLPFNLSYVGNMYKEDDEDNSAYLKLYPQPDSEGVLSCPFLIWCKENQEIVSEPQWYAMLGIVARLDNGDQLVHEFSCESSRYTPEECTTKAARALEASGPRTCSSISELWDGCRSCEHYNNTKVISPITIKSPNFIKTRQDGFYNYTVSIDPVTGNKIRKLGKPNFEDLRKYYEQVNPYKTIEDSQCVYIFDGVKWVMTFDAVIDNFCQTHMKPDPNSTYCREFRSLIQRTNIIKSDWFNPIGFINLSNGVLNVATMELLPPSKDFGFTYRLDHIYDVNATCPRFDQFMKEITLGRTDLANILLEFAGYAISNMPCRFDKSLILLGGGSNGKSTFINTMKLLVGTDNYSALTMDDLNKETGRYLLYNKLFNISEETPRKAFFDSSIFKNLSTGGDVTIKLLYKQQFSYRNRTKMILATNDMPVNMDTSYGMFRRLLIVPFDALFEGENKDRNLEDKLKSELAGIFNRVIEGYRRLLEQNNFTESVAVDREVNIYKEESDSVLQWFNEYVVKGTDDDYLLMWDCYIHFTEFCETCHMHVPNPNSFYKRLNIITKKSSDRKKIDGKAVRVKMGYRMITEEY